MHLNDSGLHEGSVSVNVNDKRFEYLFVRAVKSILYLATEFLFLKSSVSNDKMKVL